MPAPPAPPIARPELLAERIADWLREEIAEGRLAPGERLFEQALCETHGVSRVSLREAFRIVAADGLVELRANRGATVAGVSLDELRDLFGLRAAIESYAARLLAATPDRKVLSPLQAVARLIEAAAKSQDIPAYHRHTVDFHSGIVDAAGNAVMSDAYARLRMRIRRYQVLIARVPRLANEAARDHRLILRAILAGSQEDAQARTERHLARLVERYAAAA